MQQVAVGKELAEMQENVRRVVQALELCWRCQRVSECQKYVLGSMVLVWLCPRCLVELHQPASSPPKRQRRPGPSRKTVSTDCA
ncbi:MAG: hypothetical protein ACRD88_10540 [Terriglobia bacterium]